MSRNGTVEGIFVASESEAEVRQQDEVEAVAGGGLRGDRYFIDGDTKRTSGNDLTLIEQEAVEAIEREADIELAPGEHRRNIETRGVALNHLVGTRFRVGEVVCRGDILCEPCSHLQRLTQDGVLGALVHRGGLRADIVEGGTIRAVDEVVPLE